MFGSFPKTKSRAFRSFNTEWKYLFHCIYDRDRTKGRGKKWLEKTPSKISRGYFLILFIFLRYVICRSWVQLERKVMVREWKGNDSLLRSVPYTRPASSAPFAPAGRRCFPPLQNILSGLTPSSGQTSEVVVFGKNEDLEKWKCTGQLPLMLAYLAVWKSTTFYLKVLDGNICFPCHHEKGKNCYPHQGEAGGLSECVPC